VLVYTFSEPWRDIYTHRFPVMIELVSQKDPGNHEHESVTCTSGRDPIDETTSSIVSDSTEGSTIDCSSKFIYSLWHL